jgi:hypothetical protein
MDKQRFGPLKLNTGAAQMSTATIKDRLLAVLGKRFAEAVARRSAEKLQRSLQEWTDGAPGIADPTPLPIELAVAYLSSGAGFLRWLAELDDAEKGKKLTVLSV